MRWSCVGVASSSGAIWSAKAGRTGVRGAWDGQVVGVVEVVGADAPAFGEVVQDLPEGGGVHEQRLQPVRRVLLLLLVGELGQAGGVLDDGAVGVGFDDHARVVGGVAGARAGLHEGVHVGEVHASGVGAGDVRGEPDGVVRDPGGSIRSVGAGEVGGGAALVEVEHGPVDRGVLGRGEVLW